MKKGKFFTILLILILIIGLSLLLYPSISEYWNSKTQSKAIASYVEQVENMDDEAYQHIWSDAIDYNASILHRINSFVLTDEQREEYNQLLNVDGNGIMGYIEIPSINCMLSIHHGTDESVLQSSIGHMDWTSLPVGGDSTHCVVSGHRGLPSARLFTDLDQLREGDIFILHILNETLTYEVDQILIVEPHETDSLMIQNGKDLCTLVTCTPYGINTHRLLVRGHRVDNLEESVILRVTSDAVLIEPLLIACIIAVPIIIILFSILMLTDRRDRIKNKNNS